MQLSARIRGVDVNLTYTADGRVDADGKASAKFTTVDSRIWTGSGSFSMFGQAHDDVLDLRQSGGCQYSGTLTRVKS